MSRPFMPWFIGDYLRDTGHLNTEQHGAYLLLLAHCWQHECIPASAGERAAIAKLTPARWKAVCAPINRFFNEDGTQKRVTKEIERTERAIEQRRNAGQRSGVSRTLKKWQRKASELATERQRQLNERSTGDPTKTEQPANTHTHKATLSSSSGVGTAGANPTEQIPKPVAGSLATALPAGARASQGEIDPATTSAVDPRINPVRAQLEATHWRKRAPNLASLPACPCCFGWKLVPMRKTA